MARICGVCRQPPREGQEMRAMRVHEDHLEKYPEISEPGLYSACLECTDAHRKLIAEEREIEVTAVTNHMLC